MPDEPERVIREVTFAVEGDGRTIEARIVPYNTPTQVVDSPHNGGTGVPYMERWLPGAFGKQLNAANRVYLNFEHEGGIRGVVGHGVALREAPDALYGEFRVHPGADGDKALHMVNEGVLTGLSIEAIPTRTERREGIIDSVSAHLDKVSLVRRGAYEDALVLAVREARTGRPDPPEPEDPQPDEPCPNPTLGDRRGAAAHGRREAGQDEISPQHLEPFTLTVHRRAVERSALVTRTGEQTRRRTAPAGAGAERVRSTSTRSRHGGGTALHGHGYHPGAEGRRLLASWSGTTGRADMEFPENTTRRWHRARVQDVRRTPRPGTPLARRHPR